jgi:hypothetical protein
MEFRGAKAEGSADQTNDVGRIAYRIGGRGARTETGEVIRALSGARRQATTLREKSRRKP